MGFWADIQKEASQNSAIPSNAVMFVTQFQFAGNYPNYRRLSREATASFIHKTPQLYRRRRVSVCLRLERTDVMIMTARDVRQLAL